MSSAGDVTLWVHRLKVGERQAVQPLWERYFRRLVGLVRQRLKGRPRATTDEEDVALSAFDSFCRRAEEGKFPRLDDRDDLWQLLAMIASRKVYDLVEHQGREKCDWRRTQPLDEEAARGLFSSEPDPALAVEVAEESSRLLGLLPTEKMRLTAVRKLEGHTNEEIAKLLSCSPATVGRQLRLIRKHWKQELPA
jgi:DNA-directed RNA polymerase specialized sigma24 family protein